MEETEDRTASAFRRFLTGSILVLFVLVAVFIYRMEELQHITGTFQVASELSGTTQRLVKLEMAGEDGERLIQEMEEILFELQRSEEEGVLELYTLGNYHLLLSEVLEDWESLKNEIFVTRESSWEDSKILFASERLYLSTEGFSGAIHVHLQEYSDDMAVIQQSIVLNMTLTFLLLLSQGISYIQLEQRNKEISEIMFQDLHTGLYNKSKCVELIDSYPSLESVPQCAIILFDLNDLKKVNDQLGHSFGDEMILNFARCLKDAAKDHVPSPFLGRYGGDEFIVFFSQTHGGSVEEYLTFVDHYVKIANDKNVEYQLSYARGYSSRSEFQEELSLGGLLHHADQAMYLHKSIVKKNTKARLSTGSGA